MILGAFITAYARKGKPRASGDDPDIYIMAQAMRV